MGTGANPEEAPADGTPPETAAVRTVERDVEAPKVFAVEDEGLWDGRPSLGGVWVAHASVKDPERVLVRNLSNGKSVNAALFRRERENPGPKIQVSSDAAAALGMLAGAPAKLSVVALRREEVPVEPARPAAAAPSGKPTVDVKPVPKPTAAITAAAAGAIAKAEADPKAKPAEPVKTAAPAKAEAPAKAATAKPEAPTPIPAKPADAKPAEAKPAAAAPAAPTGKLLVQIGTYSSEANAQRAAGDLLKKGVKDVVIRKEVGAIKTVWRVIVGPVATPADRDKLLAQLKGFGFADAYAVSK
ncbi:SPOR domain-containing protein [Sinirhodobacter sp. WL0062]|uniref:SPOR domain-containing protein n=1 Tax=Rhodobacter flavimaris TaxID=2907145 RepID=A0ABS8YVQ4_9RHOB|nr:SPOR domain-containing protein [Sinirhodobacter sp. WL0062]MCE5972588.1 SPOR domain-containing protein [Sinirhodobacter sp. WL0062]